MLAAGPPTCHLSKNLSPLSPDSKSFSFLKGGSTQEPGCLVQKMGSTFSSVHPQELWAAQKEFHPTHHDIRAVRYLIRRYLPTELVNIILDDAGYWSLARLRTTYDGRYLALNASWSIDNDGAVCVLLSPKLSELAACASVQVRRVSFKITSHDQGWSPFAEQRSTYLGMYEDSFTWFEAVIVRSSIYDPNCVEDEEDPELRWYPSRRMLQHCDDNALNSNISAAVSTRTHDKIPKVTTAKVRGQCFPCPPLNSASTSNQDELRSDAWHIQTNIRGSRHTTSHTVAWEREPESAIDGVEHYKRTGSTLGQGFIAELTREDRIAVVARAKYPGWINYIGSVDLEVYYLV
ncbi:hypothetical protein D9619_010231 [Psilocybe cf. subviscida]|uniref:Uncharacterized protein n=1 Tax=Psilocybe cf. subviscida TaxID=2480587 RepID=A0A8H5AT92_9AGAR|nr:hypothetical protein D9619_010231 [Psilocybe cf. subviscida]